MRKYIISGGCGLFLLSVGCKTDTTLQQSEQRLVYDYQVDVEETAMSVPQKIFSVQTGTAISGFYRNTAPAYLVVYSSIYLTEAKKTSTVTDTRYVPQDTLAIVLTRPQTDTVYGLVQRVFALPQQAALRDSLHPPVYSQIHDTDPYLVVRLRPAAYNGPTYKCAGYKESNGASYTLHEYLLTLQQRHLKKIEADAVQSLRKNTRTAN